MKPYGILADLHLHAWSAFSTVDEAGRNSRLTGLLDEIHRASIEVVARGGDTLYLAGDIFHVRGSIAPSVLNPTLDCLKTIVQDRCCEVVVIPGNHDLEGKHSTRLGASVTALEGIGVKVLHEPMHYGNTVMVPWVEKIEDLKNILRSFPSAGYDLILHAPIDGVIAGLPDHGLTADWLDKLGFNRVFAGHYHNHKNFGNGVYSIGALAHHSFSDIGTLAGFLIVGEDWVEWRKSHLPEFIDIDADIDPDDLPLLVDGNFVRARIEPESGSAVEGLRKELFDLGAKGVVIQTVTKKKVTRDSAVVASVSAGASLESSVASYVKAQSFPDADLIGVECANILAEVGC